MGYLRVILAVAVFVGISSAMRCYICNSDMQKACKDSNGEGFDKMLRGCPVKSFNGLKNQKAIGCRKTEQHVGDEFTLIRECAYSGDDVYNKNQKGSTGVSRTVNQCSDKHGCNTASSYTFAISAAMALVAALR